MWRYTFQYDVQRKALSDYRQPRCDATRMRQNAVNSIPLDVAIIYVVGGKMSSNTKELAIIASSTHKNAKVIQIENIKDIKEEDLKDKKSAAIASGASTPFEI